MPTPKQHVRMASPRWAAMLDRAQQVHHTDGTKLLNAFVEAYLAGTPDLDALLTVWLPRVSPGGDRHLKPGRAGHNGSG